MASSKHASTVRLRRLAAEMRTLRAKSGLTRERVLREAGIDNATLYRIETSRTRPQIRTLTSLLALYRVGPVQQDYLLTLWRNAARAGWKRPRHSDLPDTYVAYIEFEAEASGIRDYESQFVPGLLQTEDYARALIRGTLPTATDEQVEERVQARLKRQQLLTQDGPPRLWAIVDEAVLQRAVGGADVRRAQLNHLVTQAALPHVTLQLIPFSSGAHPGMLGQLIILDFPDPLDSELVHLDGMAGDEFAETEVAVRGYLETFDTLRAIALSPMESLAMINALLNDGG